MKPFVLIGCLCALLAGFTGCESISEGMSGSLAKVAPQTRRFETAQSQVYYAAQLALKRMDFVLTRSAQAQGIVEGRSNLRDTAVFGAARQFTAKIRLLGSAGGGTEVSLLLHEQSEADFKGSASNRALREHGLYDSYFEHLTRILQEQTPAVNP